MIVQRIKLSASRFSKGDNSTRTLPSKMVQSLVGVFLMFPLCVSASGGETPVSKGLSYITSALTGATGITIATIAIMGVSLACLFHRLEWKCLLYTVAGIGGVFGAGAVVEAIKSLTSGGL